MLNLTQEEIMKNWIPTEDGKPMVSVRCIAYNHEKYIRRMIESILVQKTNFPFQIIIHDDASTDKTAEIIQEYADKYPQIIIPILEEENQWSKYDGSIERIIRPYITGKYVCLLEGDDFWIDENKLQEQHDFFEQNSNFSLVASRRVRVDENESILPYKHYKKDVLLTNNDVLHIEEMLHLSTWMYKNIYYDKQLLEKFQRFLNVGAVGDWTYMLFFADCGDIYVSKKYYSARRVILRADADNYNSIMKYKMSKFDVLKRVLLAEYNMSQLKFDRIDYRFDAVKNISKFYFNYLLSSREEKRYAKSIFSSHYIPITTRLQRIVSLFCVLLPIFEILKTKIFNFICKLETKKEISTKI